ncbi:MAG: hypothetical protein K2J77_09050 [Oscillospiraceae bacterium]|nr:hypothetical protein [Oscillospiraceae bacterium]
MNFKVIKMMFSTIVLSAFALTGCSKRADEQHKMPAVNSSHESIGEYSTEGIEMPADDTSSQSGNEPQTSIDEESQPYDEISVDQPFLDSVEQDRLYVRVYLHIDDEALRAEYEEKYPNLVENYNYWGQFLSNSGDQIIREFVCDYDIDYENLESVFKMGARFGCELDIGTISSMLNDTRVAEIIYYVGDATLCNF